MKRWQYASLVIACLFSLTYTVPMAQAQVRAFPTAEGYGAGAVGGRGGRAIIVNNLNDSGPGSFRSCAEDTGARTCIFEVGGQINLNSQITIQEANSFLTIAGQTAPGEGILITPWPIAIQYEAHDIIIRHIRHRQAHPAAPPNYNDDCGSLILWGQIGSGLPTRNAIIDHSSFGYACDDTIQAFGYVDNITYQYNIIAEGYQGYQGADPYGDSKGINTGSTYYDGGKVSVHHNMFLHMNGRTPDIGGMGVFDYRNNIVYNWLSCTGAADLGVTADNRPTSTQMNINFVGNDYIPGFNTNTVDCWLGTVWTAVIPSLYVESNRTPFCPGAPNCAQFEWNIGLGQSTEDLDFVIYGTTPHEPRFNTNFPVSQSFQSPTPFNQGPYPVTMTPVSTLESFLAARAGATVPQRDILDVRVLAELNSRTGSGGRQGAPFPSLPFAQRPGNWDTDGDGIPNTWETAKGLNPNSSADGAACATFCPGGYTNLENYINELAGDTGVVAPMPTANTIYLSAGGHGDTPSDGAGDVQSCINAENIATPKATLAGACACMNAVPGKELSIRGGTYTDVLDTDTCPILGGTSWANATRITAHQNAGVYESVTFALPAGQTQVMSWRAGQYIILNRLTIDALNRTNSTGMAFYTSANHIRVVDSVIKNTVGGFEGVYIQDADNIEFVSTTTTPTMTIHNTGTDGIGVYGAVDGLILDRVRVHTTGAKGVNLNVGGGSNTNAFINRSQVHNAGTEGIDIGPGVGAVVQSSLIYRNNAGLRIRSGASVVRVDNTNAVTNTTRGFQCDAGATVVRWRNLITWNNGSGQNPILDNCGGAPTTNLGDTIDPLFTNLGVDDYTLQATSTAINAGTPLPEVSDSFDGTARPQGIAWDIGAYERDAPPAPIDPLLKQRVPVYIQSWMY